jgi:EAL domain-containing protein (putative c-di-GMP-specific phosphodiesterase class I)
LKGCDFVQGYIFAKPMKPERIAPFIADFNPSATARMAQESIQKF